MPPCGLGEIGYFSISTILDNGVSECGEETLFIEHKCTTLWTPVNTVELAIEKKQCPSHSEFPAHSGYKGSGIQ
jgi:hypothetical protein